MAAQRTQEPAEGSSVRRDVFFRAEDFFQDVLECSRAADIVYPGFSVGAVHAVQLVDAVGAVDSVGTVHGTARNHRDIQRAGDVSTARVVNPVQTRQLLFKDIRETRRIATRTTHEDPRRTGGSLRSVRTHRRALFHCVAHAPESLEAEAEGDLDHDVFAGLEGGDGVLFMVFEGEEVED